jgi:hypothetical protein
MTAAELANAAWLMAGFDPPTPRPMIILEPRFPLGKTYATAAVTDWAEKTEIELSRYLRRHHCGDWGDLGDDDKAANESALADGTRIFSSYKTGDRKIYIITEHDRSRTTIMLATEY